jgi:serine phosphatase RsbU (regulator of sigma subunit)
VEKLMPTGIVLGALENVEYKSRSVTIGEGDVMVMFTDGVTESINAQQELFGEKRLIEVIQKNTHLSAQTILEQILASVKAFAGDMPQFDDITLLIIKGT